MKKVSRQTVVIRLTSKCQATIPEPARKVLGVGPGDEVAFEISQGSASAVVVRKAHPLDRQFATAVSDTLASEWLSQADEKAYGNL
jgi:bifunctional DNA-binding transcriptional regulator/antitoxin component of YhaV-PrlF toxin-antitoxin module